MSLKVGSNDHFYNFCPYDKQNIRKVFFFVCFFPPGNIRVLCRVKPVLKEDQHEEGQAVVVTTDPHNESALTVLSKGKAKNFELDKVFHPQATQDEVSRVNVIFT